MKNLKELVVKYVLTAILAVSVIIGVYSYAGKQSEIKKSSVQEYTVQNAEGKKLETLRLCIVDMDTINPIISVNQTVQDITKLILEPLLQLDENNRIQLALAKEWAKINDTQYLIKLKENVIWHNGNRFTAQDVIDTIDTIKRNQKSIYYANVESISEVEKIDDVTIKITLQREIPFFEYQLTFPILCSSNQDTEYLVGTGKYQMIEKQEKSIVLEPYASWWGDQTDCVIKQIQINQYDSTTTAYQKFKQGEIDMLTTSNLNIEDYIGSMGFYSKVFPDRQYDFIVCNTEKNILNQKEVRKAISYAIQREEIVTKVYQGKYQVANLPLENSHYLNINKTEETFQPEKSKEILKQGDWEETDKGWYKTQNGKKVRLQLTLTVCSENEQRVKVAELIKTQLEKIGILIQVRAISLSDYNQCLTNKQYELLLAGMQTSFAPDLTSYIGEGNLANFKSEEINTLLSDVMNITEEIMLKQSYRRMIELMQEEVPYIGLYFHTKTLLYQKNIMGQINPTAYQLFYYMDTWYRKEE